jgi:hypothetical protein
MLLPFTDGLVKTTHFDPECRMLADRHYSRRTAGARQFLYAGRKLVLRDAAGDVLFGWMWPFDHLRMDGQTGYNCAIFRNESDRLASEIILEAENAAVAHWGQNRCYTYVNPKKIASTNPGYCFQKAGWRKAGQSNGGLLLFVKDQAGERP